MIDLEQLESGTHDSNLLLSISMCEVNLCSVVYKLQGEVGSVPMSRSMPQWRCGMVDRISLLSCSCARAVENVASLLNHWSSWWSAALPVPLFRWLTLARRPSFFTLLESAVFSTLSYLVHELCVVTPSTLNNHWRRVPFTRPTSDSREVPRVAADKYMVADAERGILRIWAGPHHFHVFCFVKALRLFKCKFQG